MASVWIERRRLPRTAGRRYRVDSGSAAVRRARAMAAGSRRCARRRSSRLDLRRARCDARPGPGARAAMRVVGRRRREPLEGVPHRRGRGDARPAPGRARASCCRPRLAPVDELDRRRRRRRGRALADGGLRARDDPQELPTSRWCSTTRASSRTRPATGTVKLPRGEQEEPNPPTAAHVEAVYRLLPRSTGWRSCSSTGRAPASRRSTRRSSATTTSRAGASGCARATTKTRRALWVELHPALAEALERALGPREDRDPTAACSQARAPTRYGPRSRRRAGRRASRSFARTTCATAGSRCCICAACRGRGSASSSASATSPSPRHVHARPDRRGRARLPGAARRLSAPRV